ncbi:MAG: hypothetical protein LBV16_09550 [Elusimicrobiota bacterium]|nr:hypothetical protein [Elusimicrobiota bacterium]
MSLILLKNGFPTETFGNDGVGETFGNNEVEETLGNDGVGEMLGNNGVGETVENDDKKQRLILRVKPAMTARRLCNMLIVIILHYNL